MTDKARNHTATVRLNDEELAVLEELAQLYESSHAFILRRGLWLVQRTVDEGLPLRGQLRPPDGP